VGFIHRDIHHALLFIAHPCPLHTSKHVHDGRERSLLATADKIGGREREEILHHHCTPPGTSTVAANEVNDIVICLLATADKIGGHEREQILHHVDRLSRAAMRKRNTAIDKMQKLRKKVVQQSAEPKRIENASQARPAPQGHSDEVVRVVNKRDAEHLVGWLFYRREDLGG
jgi:hypothetical protein